MWKQESIIKPVERKQHYDTEKDFEKSSPEYPYELAPQDALDLYEDAIDAIDNQLPRIRRGAAIYISRLSFFTRMKWKLLGWQPEGLRRALECRAEFQKWRMMFAVSCA